MTGKWVLEAKPVPHLRFESKHPFLLLFSARHGLSFLERYSVRSYCYLKQVHGDKIIEISRGFCPRGDMEGDGFLVREHGIFAGIRVADCYPVFIGDPIRKNAVLIHAGWRGLKAGIIASAMDLLAEEGSDPQDLVAAAGPGISGEVYEVGEDVGSLFPGFVRREGAKLFLDLRGFIRAELLRRGVAGDNIVFAPYCTYRDDKLFHSRRREGERTGYMWAIMGLI